MRKIFLVTERRADFSRFKPILKLIEKDPELDYDLCVTGIHLLKENGMTINEIINDGFKIFSTFDMFDGDEDTGAGMSRALGKAIIALTYEIEKSKPDIILSGFDIAANMAVTIVGAHMNIPVAHIQGGEVTGTIDESIRHAMSKFSHYHFAANEDATSRLIKMGEVPDHVFSVGCPSLDAILDVKIRLKNEILDKFHLNNDYVLVLQHPVTTEIKSTAFQIEQTIDAIKELGISALVIFPNNDAGYSQIVQKIKDANLNHLPTLSLEEYVNVVTHAKALVGNSSSGIHETATLGIPTVNIGSRQQGRQRPPNVIDVDHDKTQIKNAILKCLNDNDFLKVVKQKGNPYGDGQSAEKIIELLKKIDISDKIIQKQITY
jgi:UDP-N-acetylglucosamine 2-epimerase (non-hydrolysing)/GDP/UDP-N,N'-diacetylbacillosamine 2-epimerase (hydrolysing)